MGQLLGSTRLALATLLAFVTALVVIIQLRWSNDMEAARREFREEHHAETLQNINNFEDSIRSIYENLRTLAALPSVRGIDRHATNMGEEARTTFQQIYNNLAETVAISEVYVVPIDFSPEKIDPITLKKEEPIISFDQLIVNAGSNMSRSDRLKMIADPRQKDFKGPPEIEDFEYRQMVDHLAWLKSHYPTVSRIDGFNPPFISGPEVTLCDNTRFIKSGVEHDRAGLIFSVPFYGPSGEIKGMISAMVLSTAVRELLPADYLVLVNPGNGYVNHSETTAAMEASSLAVKEAKPDRNLVYSEAVSLGVKDARNPWFIWAGAPLGQFEESHAVHTAYAERYKSLSALALLGIAIGICIQLARRNLEQARDLATSLKSARDLAEKSEAEALQSAEKLRLLNNDISKLNSELAEKLNLLSEAQDEIIRKGKMAQLGSLVATVAHEIRNPLGGIRTTAFTLQRKLKDSPVEVAPLLRRIETGINRCDSIITQLLDFSRSQPVHCEVFDAASWLQDVLRDEAERLPAEVEIQLNLPEGEAYAGFDDTRLRRSLVSLIANAAEALTSKANMTGRPPVIEVDLKKSSRGVEFTVRDNGPGVPSAMLSKVGEPLFTTKSFGTGLGLAAARKVAELHGGGFEIQSTEGKGASFTIWIPPDAVKVKAA